LARPHPPRFFPFFLGAGKCRARRYLAQITPLERMTFPPPPPTPSLIHNHAFFSTSVSIFFYIALVIKEIRGPPRGGCYVFLTDRFPDPRSHVRDLRLFFQGLFFKPDSARSLGPEPTPTIHPCYGSCRLNPPHSPSSYSDFSRPKKAIREPVHNACDPPNLYKCIAASI